MPIHHIFSKHPLSGFPPGFLSDLPFPSGFSSQVLERRKELLKEAMGVEDVQKLPQGYELTLYADSEEACKAAPKYTHTQLPMDHVFITVEGPTPPGNQVNGVKVLAKDYKILKAEYMGEILVDFSDKSLSVKSSSEKKEAPEEHETPSLRERAGSLFFDFVSYASSFLPSSEEKSPAPAVTSASDPQSSSERKDESVKVPEVASAGEQRTRSLSAK